MCAVTSELPSNIGTMGPIDSTVNRPYLKTQPRQNWTLFFANATGVMQKIGLHISTVCPRSLVQF